MLNCRVNLGQLDLEVCRPSIQLRYEDGKLTENVRVDDCTQEQANCGHCYLRGAPWPSIITCC